jgi:hypothetical protein
MGGKLAAEWAVLVVIFGCGCGGRTLEDNTASAGAVGAAGDIIFGGAPAVGSSAPTGGFRSSDGGSSSSAGQPAGRSACFRQKSKRAGDA